MTKLTPNGYQVLLLLTKGSVTISIVANPIEPRGLHGEVRSMSETANTIQGPRKDSTENIARRYRHLFRLPSTSQSILFASVPIITIELMAGLVLRASVGQIALYAAATELIFIVTIGIDLAVLRQRSKIATFRRLSAISIISNLIWFLLAIVALAAYGATRSEVRFFSLILLGAFFAISFRTIVFGSVFYESPIRGLPQAVVQPILLIFPIGVFFSEKFAILTANTFFGIAGGTIVIIAVEVYLYSINRPIDSHGFKALRLLQAFLKAWTVENPVDIEKFLDSASKERKVKTTIIRFDSDFQNAQDPRSGLLIVPGIHPGPFYPIGSSNLPADIFGKFHSENIFPIIVHSISDHELNLPSKLEVDHYVETLHEAQTTDSGNTISRPVVLQKNKATVSGLALGHSLVIALTQAPYGMEDFPIEVGKSIEEASKLAGFVSSFVIDTHNSEGAKPNEKECLDIVEESKLVIRELAAAPQFKFKVGLAHSSEMSIAQFPKDIGPAGVALLLFEVEGGGNDTRFCFVNADANNSRLGFRERVFELFEKQTNTRILELSTSDTHVTAAKAQGAKGYLALGDVISAEEFTSILQLLYERAKSRVAEGKFSTAEVVSQVKTIGIESLNDFSGLLDKTSSAAKRGAQALSLLALLVTAAVTVI